MKPLSKSLWIIPAHWGAFIPFLNVQALHSSVPEVKNVARQQADQIISEAQREAENIIRSSKESALRAVEDLEQQIRMKEQQYNEAKKQFDIYKAKMEALLISQLELLKDINRRD